MYTASKLMMAAAGMARTAVRYHAVGQASCLMTIHPGKNTNSPKYAIQASVALLGMVLALPPYPCPPVNSNVATVVKHGATCKTLNKALTSYQS